MQENEEKKGRHVLTPEEGRRGVENRLAAETKEVAVVHQITTYADCDKEEILEFCLQELRGGTTYNDLRKKLGLGPAHTDGRWRKMRKILSDLILPENEEEAVLAGYSASQYMVQRMEKFLKRLSGRLQEAASERDKNEFHYWKIELETMQSIIDKQGERTEQYLQMKALQKAEKGRRGSTIIFQNNFKIPRPGEVLKDVSPMEDAAKLVAAIHQIEDQDE